MSKLFPLVWLAALLAAQTGDPRSVADELFAADQAASAASTKTTAIPGLTGMFARDVILQSPAVGFARGIAAATEALKANPDNAEGKVVWTPVRAGISADGQHGFTFGFMTLRRPDGSSVLIKYLAYWIKRGGRWEVAAYKRRLRPSGEVLLAAMPPSLPDKLVTGVTDRATLAAFEKSLIAAENAFSDEAQQIVIGPAFTKYGAADAMNMGSPNDAGFVIGAGDIGKSIGQGQPTNSSPVSWSADSAIVSSTGDFGVTFGYIRQNGPSPDGSAAPAPAPFFTIWRRANASAPWRYIAE